MSRSTTASRPPRVWRSRGPPITPAAAVTRWILDQLAAPRSGRRLPRRELARRPELVRAIHKAGHEVASHGWDHRRVLAMAPEQFRDDLRRARTSSSRSPATRSSATGRRPSASSGGPPGLSTSWPRRASSTTRRSTPCVTTATACPTRPGVRSSPRAGACDPRDPAGHLAAGRVNLPAGGGGYFRLFPWRHEAALAQAADSAPPRPCCTSTPGSSTRTAAAPLGRARRFRTYVGLSRAQGRLSDLMASGHGFVRASDVVARLGPEGRMRWWWSYSRNRVTHAPSLLTSLPRRGDRALIPGSVWAAGEGADQATTRPSDSPRIDGFVLIRTAFRHTSRDFEGRP